MQITLEWPDPEPARELSEAVVKAFFDTIALEHRYQDDRYLRPSVEGDDKPAPSSLMTWWLLLYSLSMLARYQPRKWLGLLDLDSSLEATPLRYALDVALTVVPHLVLGALDGKPLVL